jgi:chromosome segregation ATPase
MNFYRISWSKCINFLDTINLGKERESFRKSHQASSKLIQQPAEKSGSDPLANPNPNSEIQLIRLEKEIKKLRRENKRFLEEINKLNNLIEQMKNIDDDELLMIEKIQTKEIYGKAQKLKISEIQKETEILRIEIDRLKVVNNNKDRIVREKDTEIRRYRDQVETIRREKGKERVVYKTEYKESPASQKRIQDLEIELRNLRNMPPKIQTVN